MFGRRKKKYIKEFEGTAFKTQDTIKKSTGLAKPTDNATDLRYRRKSTNSNRKEFKFDLDSLLHEDSILIQVENSWLESQKSQHPNKLTEVKFQKPATRFLNLIALVLTLRFGSFLLNADFLKVNSIAYIFFLIIPFIVVMPIIFIGVFSVWKKRFSPVARVIIRKALRYWYLILGILYFIFINYIFDKMV